MKYIATIRTLVLAMSILFTWLFWQQFLGVNLLLFTTALFLIVLYRNRFHNFKPKVILVLAGTLLSGIMVVLYNSITSKLCHIASFYVLCGFLYAPQIHTVFNSFRVAVSTSLSWPGIASVFFASNKKEGKLSGTSALFFYIRLVVIPVITVAVFYILYSVANPVFNELSQVFWKEIAIRLSRFFLFISIQKILFTGFGLILVSPLVYGFWKHSIVDKEAGKPEIIQRKRSHTYHRVNHIIGLKKEYKAALILLVLVNLLLVIVNIIDINWLWINFNPPRYFNYKPFVHEGTYVLIFSILLSMAIILFFFRKNLNFYPHNGILKTLAYIWMTQNFVLLISVMVRNYHFIHIHGLAYKRIGVIIFLMLTAAGIITMILKIHRAYSVFYLLKVNSWAAYIMWVVMSCVNWDMTMARFNLNHWNDEGIDVDFYYTLSPKVLPLLYDHLPKIESQIQANQKALKRNTWTQFPDFTRFLQHLEKQKSHYIRQWDLCSWKSWNMTDNESVRKLRYKKISSNLFQHN